ncbi:hypothetical protein I4U23_004061 [Adineta vaga]|nr:hypothetical protein I4U23_004061 [Adineta vaga]
MVSNQLICRICGDRARGMNFGVMTCMSSKSFFRRNALKPANSFQCSKSSTCEINKEKRMKCTSCRLKKCLLLGMKSELIRSFNQYQLTKPKLLNLLENDCSNLTNDQWNLLSNIHHIFNEKCIIDQIQSSLQVGSSLPIKLRIKSSFALNCFYHCFSSMEVLFQKSSFSSLIPLKTQQYLIHRNIYAISSLKALYLPYQSNIWNNKDFQMSFIDLYDENILKKITLMNENLDSNGLSIKLMLFIITYSSNYSIVNYNPLDKDLAYLSNCMFIQDICVSLLWNYLNYQFGFKESVIRYSSMIKSLLDILLILEYKSNISPFTQMINNIVQQTEQSIILQD